MPTILGSWKAAEADVLARSETGNISSRVHGLPEAKVASLDNAASDVETEACTSRPTSKFVNFVSELRVAVNVSTASRARERTSRRLRW